MPTSNIKVIGMDHIVLHVRDLEVSKRFYIDVLGFELRHEGRPGQKMTFLRCGTQGLDLRETDTDIHGGEEMNHLALDVEFGERDEIVAELAKFGIAVHGRYENDVDTVHFYDPDGHRVQLQSVSEQQYKRDTLYPEGATSN